jgi:hypothetical protein
MYDEIGWEAELPAGHPAQKRLFQTKSLHRCLDRYVVTEAGRLCLVGNGWRDDVPFDGAHNQREGCVANYRMSTLCFIPKAQLMGVSGQ